MKVISQNRRTLNLARIPQSVRSIDHRLTSASTNYPTLRNKLGFGPEEWAFFTQSTKLNSFPSPRHPSTRAMCLSEWAFWESQLHFYPKSLYMPRCLFWSTWDFKSWKLHSKGRYGRYFQLSKLLAWPTAVLPPWRNLVTTYPRPISHRPRCRKSSPTSLPKGSSLLATFT